MHERVPEKLLFPLLPPAAASYEWISEWFSILQDTGGEFVDPHLSTLFDESNEGSLPCVSTRLLGKPRMHAAEIERGSREDLLQMDFCLSAVACVP